MSLLTRFTRLVEHLESGGCPPHFPDRSAAYKALVDELSVAPWQTPEERHQAQHLIARLERLRWAEQGQDLPPSRQTA